MTSTYLKKLCLLLAFLVLTGMPAAAANVPIRISGWYWLNSAPKNEWERDFKKMHELGFTHVVLGWGLNSSAVALRIQDTLDAMRWAHKAGLGSYLVVWHPTHNSLERKPEYQQVDAAGNHLFNFDTFNPEWRRTQWKEYLQTLARIYGKEPGMTGYLFDDSFGIGPIGTVSGPSPKPENAYISYNNIETKLFDGQPPRSKDDPKWKAWREARAIWWVEWGKDTVRFIREIDSDPKHEIYLEDADYILGESPKDRAGVDFGRVAQVFDAVCAYTTPPYSAKDADTAIVKQTRDVITKTRQVIGKDKKIIFTFWSADLATELKPGHATYPTVDQIRNVAETALSLGIRHLDMYGYRIGDYRVSDKNWKHVRPDKGPSYKLTGQFPNKFLWDRPELFKELQAYLHSLQKR